MSAVLALAGGVGGAKLAQGLALAGATLAVLVNTGDDFEHMGLHVSPDIDTVVYTLAGLANRVQGWGLEGESWAFMEQAARLGGPDWFRLGDRDLAMHVLRSERLRRGERLSAITADLARRLGVRARVLPMADEPVRTRVEGPAGEVAFQDYFVRQRCEMTIRAIRFAGIERARPTPELCEALADPALGAIVVCPSNPYVSIDPILAVPGLRDAITARGVPIVAVSPIIAGAAVKGPAAAMLRDLGAEVSALGVARRYAGLVDGFVLDGADASLAPAVEGLGMAVCTTDTWMPDEAARERLAGEVLRFAASIARRR